MGRLVKLLAALVVAAGCALLVREVLLPHLARPDRPPPPSPEVAHPGLPDGFERRVMEAGDLEAAAMLHDAIDRAQNGATLRELYERRGALAAERLSAQVEREVQAFRYATAAARAEEYRRAWRGTHAQARMTELLDEVREIQNTAVQSRRAEADALVDEGRLEAARETLRTAWELEPEYRARLDAHARAVEERIARLTHSPPPPPAERPTFVAVDPADPPAPPTLPGTPHPDVKRLREARELLRSARSLADASRHDAASRTIAELVDSYGDLSFVKRRREALAALRALAEYRKRGVMALFRATEAKRRGKRVALTYAFTSADELLDWESMKTIAHKSDGRFEAIRGGVRGTGAQTLVLRAYFENDVTIRCRSTPAEPRTHGLAFCQARDETRQVMLLVTNHWFVEGENYVKERPGHSLIMIGKGTNADVPVDSPETGFIFRVTRAAPEVPAGAEAALEFRLDGSRMEATVACGGSDASLRGEARGDDGRGIERLRPALFVVDAAAVFRAVVIEGVLHPDSERDRVRELERLVEALED
jgi:tetratricopeptide (TPR) repeat protein